MSKINQSNHTDSTKIRLLFTGDACSIGSFDKSLYANIDIIDSNLRTLLKQQDFVIANLEGPATLLPNINNPKRICSIPKFIPYLIENNIQYFNLANNHTFDCGENGFNETVEHINKNGGYFFGAGNNLESATQPIILEKNDIKIGVLSSTYKDAFAAQNNRAGVAHFLNIYQFKKKVVDLKKKVDFIVYSYHGDSEYIQYPLPAKRRFLQQASQLPIDLIVCHHPHVVQGWEKINDTTIFYSLGNFIFDTERQRQFNYTENGNLLAVEITKSDTESNNNWKLIPIFIDGENATVVLDQKIKQNESLNDFQNYKTHFLDEAERVFTEDKLNRKTKSDYATLQTSNDSNTKNKSKPNKLLSKSFYKALFSALSNPHYRPILLGYMEKKAKNLFK